MRKLLFSVQRCFLGKHSHFREKIKFFLKEFLKKIQRNIKAGSPGSFQGEIFLTRNRKKEFFLFQVLTNTSLYGIIW